MKPSIPPCWNDSQKPAASITYGVESGRKAADYRAETVVTNDHLESIFRQTRELRVRHGQLHHRDR